MNKGRNLKHPARRGQTKRHAALPTYDSHHIAVRNRVRRSQVDRPAEIILIDQPFDGVAKILFVNPGDELVPAGNGASSSQSIRKNRLGGPSDSRMDLLSGSIERPYVGNTEAANHD